MGKPQLAYALILCAQTKSVLVCELPTGEWRPPGGPVEKDETEFSNLARHVLQQTGLVVEVVESIGPEHVINGRTARAFDCQSIHETSAGTALAYGWINKEDVLKRPFTHPAILRMVLDALSILEEPDRTLGNFKDTDVIYGIEVTPDGYHLQETTFEECRIWPRLDPSSPTGKMEPSAPA
jgi:hypothetical protein